MNSYHKFSKILHWVIAVIVLAMLSLSFFLGDVPDSLKPSAYTIHKSLGLTVLFLMLIRIFWIFYIGRPSLPSNTPNWEYLLSRVVQYSFYIFLIIMPLAGWIMATASNRSPVYFGIQVLPCPWITPDPSLAKFMNLTHKTCAWILLGLVFLHISGALKHHFLNKDDVLKKML